MKEGMSKKNIKQITNTILPWIRDNSYRTNEWQEKMNKTSKEIGGDRQEKIFWHRKRANI